MSKDSPNTTPAFSSQDGLADMILGLIWLGTFYVIGIIFTSLALIDRWRGPYGDGKIDYIAVLSAIGMACAWPVVLFSSIFS